MLVNPKSPTQYVLSNTQCDIVLRLRQCPSPISPFIPAGRSAGHGFPAALKKLRTLRRRLSHEAPMGGDPGSGAGMTAGAGLCRPWPVTKPHSAMIPSCSRAVNGSRTTRRRASGSSLMGSPFARSAACGQRSEDTPKRTHASRAGYIYPDSSDI